MQHVRAALADLRQAPGHGAVIVFGPAGLLIFFSLTRVTGPLSANFFLASAAVLAIVGAAFNQMGAGLAHDRGRCLSDPSAPPVAGRIGARAIGTAMIAATWVFLALSLVIGSVPIILAAMCVALWARPEAARTIANIVFFLFSFGAGLVLPPWSLPRLVWQASVILPSRHLADVAWAPALGWDLALGNWAWLAGFTAVLGGAAALGLRRAVRQA